MNPTDGRGVFKCRVEVPNEGENHGTTKAENVLVKERQFSPEFVDSLIWRVFRPIKERDETTVYAGEAYVEYGDQQ